MAGGQELLEGAVWKRVLPLQALLPLTDQQAGALVDVVQRQVSLAGVVLQQRAMKRIRDWGERRSCLAVSRDLHGLLITV